MAVLSLAENHKDFLMRSDINRSKKKKKKRKKKELWEDGCACCVIKYTFISDPISQWTILAAPRY